MRRARFLASVRADFLGILTYIAVSTGSIAGSEIFVAMLRAKCHALAAMQAIIGRPRPELRPSPVMTGLVQACPGHPRRSEIGSREIGRVGSAPPFRPHIGSGLYTTTWMTGTSPVMTIRRRLRCVAPHRSGRL